MGKTPGHVDVLASATLSASSNMILQLMFRVITFVLNAFLIRRVSKDILGVVNVRLLLLHSTTLFICGEAFRRACMSKSKERCWTQTMNLLWCAAPLSIVCVGILGYVWLHWLEQPSVDSVPYYSLGVATFALSAVIELFILPVVVMSQVLLFVRLKVVIGSLAILLRSLVTLALVALWPQLGVMAFCIAELSYSGLQVMLYYSYFILYASRSVAHKKDDNFPFASWREFFPRRCVGKPTISHDEALLAVSFFKQGFLKQFLTEGERYVMTLFNVIDFAHQGTYDIINNLGSLAARFVFLPIEDAGYLFFTQLIDRDQPIEKQAQETVEFTAKVLKLLLRFVTLVGLIILIYGFPYSFLLLDIYGGATLSAESVLLRWYCVYVLLLAINGSTECFTFAAMSKRQVDAFNKKMLAFSLMFLVSSWYLTKLFGSVGFILANCCNMSARILHSIYFIHHYFKETSLRPLHGLFPSVPVIFCFLVSLAVTATSEKLFCCNRGLQYRLLHVIVGGASLLIVAAVTYVSEVELVQFAREQWLHRKQQTRLKTE